MQDNVFNDGLNIIVMPVKAIFGMFAAGSLKGHGIFHSRIFRDFRQL